MAKAINLNADMGEGFGAYDIVCYAGSNVTHLKPDVSLNNMAAENLELALAIGRAIKTVDRDIIYVALAGSQMETAGRELGLPVAREGFCDRLYDDDGNLTSRKVPGAVLHDPEVVRVRVVNMVLNDEIVSRNGKSLKVRLDTLCVHGDEPSGVIVARAARQGLEAASVRVVTLPEMTLS